MKIISYIVQIIGQRRATKRCQPFPLSFFPASNWQTNTLAHKQPSRILFYHRENKYPRFRPRSKIPSNVPIRNNGVVEQWPGSRLGVFTWRRRRQSIMPMSAAVKTMIDRSTDNPWIPSRLPRQQKEEPDEYNLSTGVIFGKTEGGRGGKALPRLINKNHAIVRVKIFTVRHRGLALSIPLHSSFRSFFLLSRLWKVLREEMEREQLIFPPPFIEQPPFSIFRILFMQSSLEIVSSYFYTRNDNRSRRALTMLERKLYNLYFHFNPFANQKCAREKMVFIEKRKLTMMPRFQRKIRLDNSMILS